MQERNILVGRASFNCILW